VRKTLSVTSSVVAANDQVSSDLGGEVVILHLEAGQYYSLETVGARIWSLIQEPRPVEEIRDILVSEYEVEPGRCESDLLALLHRLSDEGLIDVRDETST
jgi:Coenzyme PQQ synthesis protein D (PqqD)